MSVTGPLDAEVVVVGAGLAGLACAQDLTDAGVTTLVVEASDGVGGRARSDVVDGYTLDRGFQVVLTAYPQLRKRIDLGSLSLGRFAPGALVRTPHGLHRVADPLRRPADLLSTVTAPVGTFADKLRMARLALDARTHSATELLRRPDATTAQRLARAGFSDRFVDWFLRPLFAGIQLDPDLQVSARRFDVVLRMLAVGETGLPRDGVGALAAQLAGTLPPGAVRLHAPAAAVDGTAVRLADGERLGARAVVVATDGPAAHRLLGSAVPDPGSRSVACCWFSTAAPPVRGPWLLLDGSVGPAANVTVASEVQPAYAPPGSALVAAAVPGPRAFEPGLAGQVRSQLARWFGGVEADFTLLRTDVIEHGQPDQAPPLRPRRRVGLGGGRFVCGDHRDTASVQGALFSGERTAAAVLAHLHTRD